MCIIINAPVLLIYLRSFFKKVNHLNSMKMYKNFLGYMIFSESLPQIKIMHYALGKDQNCQLRIEIVNHALHTLYAFNDKPSEQSTFNPFPQKITLFGKWHKKNLCSPLSSSLNFQNVHIMPVLTKRKLMLLLSA